MLNRVRLYNLGRLDYRKCLGIQKHLVDESLNRNGRDSLLLVEHEPVYTIGIRRQKYPPSELEKLSRLAQVESTDRGGLITFHGPGQLVAYPILNLKQRHFNSSLKWYVKQLEQLVIDLCRDHYNINAYRLCTVGYTGVWCDGDRKIAAIGVHCKRYVTYHGLAINCNVDMKWFEKIVPCGIEDKEVTSLSRVLAREVTVAHAAERFENVFEKLFGVQLERTTPEQVEKLKTDAESFIATNPSQIPNKI